MAHRGRSLPRSGDARSQTASMQSRARRKVALRGMSDEIALGPRRQRVPSGTQTQLLLATNSELCV